MTDFDLIIFDCDGTLTDSEYLNNLATVRLFEKLGLTGYTVEEITTRFLGLYLSRVAEIIGKETGFAFPPNVDTLFTQTVLDMLPEYLKPVPFVDEAVEALRQSYKICVASNGQRENVVESLRQTGLLPLFGEQHVFAIEQVKLGKPDPEIYLLAAKTMGIAPPRCLVIEDSVNGVRAGKAAGMTVFGFTGVAHDKIERAIALKQAGADAVFDSFIHIRDALIGQKPCISATRRAI